LRNSQSTPGWADIRNRAIIGPSQNVARVARLKTEQFPAGLNLSKT
jgi:hypothetical protein